MAGDGDDNLNSWFFCGFWSEMDRTTECLTNCLKKILLDKTITMILLRANVWIFCVSTQHFPQNLPQKKRNRSMQGHVCWKTGNNHRTWCHSCLPPWWVCENHRQTFSTFFLLFLFWATWSTQFFIRIPKMTTFFSSEPWCRDSWKQRVVSQAMPLWNQRCVFNRNENLCDSCEATNFGDSSRLVPGNAGH